MATRRHIAALGSEGDRQGVATDSWSSRTVRRYIADGQETWVEPVEVATHKRMKLRYPVR